MSAAVPTIYESIVCPTGPGNPRNGEAAIVELANGELLLAYTRFGEWLPGSFAADAIELKLGSDHYPADIRACFSKDNGYTWSDPCVFQENVSHGQAVFFAASFPSGSPPPSKLDSS